MAGIGFSGKLIQGDVARMSTKKKRSIGPKNMDYILIQVAATNACITGHRSAASVPRVYAIVGSRVTTKVASKLAWSTLQ